MFLAAAPVVAIAIPGSIRLFESDTTKTTAVASTVRLEADLSKDPTSAARAGHLQILAKRAAAS